MPSTAIDFHHLLVHFPIALILAGAALQAIAAWRHSGSFQFAARANFVAGAAGSVFAVASGLLGEDGHAHSLLEAHETLGIATMVLALMASTAWLLRPVEIRTRGSFLALGALAVAAGTVGATGWIGGEIAHGHGDDATREYGKAGDREAGALREPRLAAIGPIVRAPDPGGGEESSADDRAIFEARCSLCHSIRRPLDSGHTDSEWPGVIARMAARSDGAITAADQAAILRYLRSLPP